MAPKEQKQDLIEYWEGFLNTCQEQHMQMIHSLLGVIERTMPFSIAFFDTSRPMEHIFVKDMQALAADPYRLLQAQEELVEEMNGLWEKILSLGTGEPPESPSDKRFQHKAWQTVPYFFFIKEYYLMTSRWIEKLVSQLEGLDAQTTKKIRFYTKQILDAASPTNSPFTNPEVLEVFMKTKGESLKRGLETFLQDMAKGQWMQMTDPSAFQIGETVASTKGEVVYRNHLFELIHYAPLTKKQYSIPLLIIPAWINKYYIFDLSTSNSFCKWMVEQGHNVFIISWINPGPELALMTFQDYLLDGAYCACDVVSSLTKSPSLHTMGFCMGGNLLAALNAYLSKVSAPFSLKTMTLLATIFDFNKLGDLKIFIDETYLEMVEKTMTQNGFLHGEFLKTLFSILRPNDLIWSFFIKNYFLGQVPPAFDFLYWNSDSTRLPANLHRFVLRKFFQENLFMQPEGIRIQGIPLDLREITTPTLLLSTIEDHISPWESSYPAVHLFKGPVKFILAGSGHVAGIINHPSKNKYGFLTNSYFPSNAHEWLESSTKNEGSWWTNWHDWVTTFSRRQISSLVTYPFLESAPGSYVKSR